MINLFLNKKGYSNEQKYIFLFFIICLLTNYGNYSWLYYNYDGTPWANNISLFFRNLRIFIPSILIFYLFINSNWRKKMSIIISKNIEIYILSFIYFFNLIFSKDIITSFTYAYWFFTMLLLVHLTVFEIRKIDDLVILLKIGSLVTIVLTFLSFPSILIDNEASLFSSKNYYAYPILIFVLCELFLLSKKSIKYSVIFSWIFISICIALLFLSGRRAPLICSLIGLIIFFRKNKFIFLTIFLILITFFSFIISYSVLGFSIEDSLTYNRIIRPFENQDVGDTSLEQRLYIWNLYLEFFNSSPIIGTGLNQDFSSYFNQSLDFDFTYHNSFLQVLIEGGIFGLACVIIHYFRAIFNFFKNHLDLNLTFFIIPTILINYFESNFLPGHLFFIYTFAILSFLINRR